MVAFLRINFILYICFFFSTASTAPDKFTDDQGMLMRSPQLARLGCQPFALRTPLLLRTLAAKAERKAGKKAAQALKLTRALQQEEAQAFRSGKVPTRSAQLSSAQHSTARHSTALHSTGCHVGYI